MRALLGLLGVLLLAGCGDDDQSMAAPSSRSLEGVAWVLSSGIDVAGWEQVAPTATFANGRLAGFNGCNSYTTSYTTERDTIDIGQIAGTMMACSPPGDAVEQAFASAMGQVSRWQVDGDELVLLDGGKEQLRFRESSPVGAWEATSFLQGDAIKSTALHTKVTAVFADSGALSGSAGCNSYSTTYTVDGDAITIKPPAVTKKLCVKPEGVMEQEQAYLSALQKATSYTIEGNMLTLLRPKGTIAATFVRTP